MSQCCNTPLYISDSHCPDCGTEVEAPPILKSAFTIDPTIDESYQGSTPSFTGRVIDTYYYTRSNSALSSGYLWITLITDKNEEKKFSIQGESETFQNIKVGDVLSLVAPYIITQHHQVNRSDRKIVTHDNSPAIIVYHRVDNTNISSVEPCLSNPGEVSPSPGSCWFAALLGMGLVWAMHFKWNVEPTSWWFIGACIFPVICILLARSASKSNKVNQAIADSVEDARLKVMNIYYSELGYERHTRPGSHLDIICSSCHNSINHLSLFCCHCGVQQNKQSSAEQLAAPISDVTENAAEETSNLSIVPETKSEEPLTSNVINMNAPTQTVREHNAAIFSQFDLDEEFDYVHKHALSFNKAHQVTTTCRLVRVIDKHMGVNVNQGVHETTHRTEYKNRYGVVVDTKDQTTYRSYRDVYLEGFLIIEDKNGAIIKFSSNAAILKLTNVGDLILIGESTMKREDQTHYLLEYVYNVNKDKKVDNLSQSLSTYYPSYPILSVLNLFLFPVLLVLASLAIATVVDSNIVTTLAALGVFGIGAFYYCLFPLVFASQNTGNKKHLLPNLLSKLQECVKNRKTILEEIK